MGLRCVKSGMATVSAAAWIAAAVQAAWQRCDTLMTAVPTMLRHIKHMCAAIAHVIPSRLREKRDVSEEQEETVPR